MLPPEHVEPDPAPMPIWRPTAAETQNARQTLADLRNRLGRDLGAATCEVFLYAARGRRIEDHYRRLVMTAELASDFKIEFDTSVRRLIATAVDNPDGLRPSAFDDHIESTIAYLPLASMGRFGANIAHVPPDGTWEMIFDPSEAFADSLKTIYISIAFTNPRERLLIAQAYSSSRVLKRGISAHFVRGQFDRLETGSVLTLNPDVHFILWRDNIFMTRLDKFESQTQYREATTAIAGQVWDALIAELPFHDADTLRRNLLAKPIYSKKLSKLSQVDYMDRLQMNIIQQQIADHGLPMRIEDRNGQQYLVLDDPNDPRALADLLKLLDDDLWRSALTGNRYAARAKDKR